MDFSNVIIEPLLTEKTNLLREGEFKKYVFKVDSRANKLQIQKAVEKLFNVKAIQVRVLNVGGKEKTVAMRGGRRGTGFTSSWKKAYVTLDKNQKIDYFEGV